MERTCTEAADKRSSSKVSGCDVPGCVAPPLVLFLRSLLKNSGQLVE